MMSDEKGHWAMNLKRNTCYTSGADKLRNICQEIPLLYDLVVT